MPTVNVATEEWGWAGSVINILQVSDLEPADGDTGLAPGTPVIFNLLNSGHPRVFDFEDQSDALWERCTYGNGFTAAYWNAGGSDEWDIYADDGNYVYRAQDQATSLLDDIDLHSGSMGAFAAHDIVVRMKWFTGTTAGVFAGVRHRPYEKVTSGPYGTGVEIDSGGLRLVYYYNNTRYLKATSSFTPNDGEWYWMRIQAFMFGNRYWRAKVWQGLRSDEDDTWDITWYNQGLYFSGTEDTGIGVRVHAGTAYFDDFEVARLIDPDYTSKLEVTVGGVSCTVANGRLKVYPNTYSETWNTSTFIMPQVNDWRVEASWSDAAEAITGTVDVVIEYDGVTLSSTDFDVTRIPGAWPTYDPDTEDPSGDPDRMSWFDLGNDGWPVPLGVFSTFRTIFPLSYGTQDVAFTLCPLTWPLYGEDFTWILWTKYSTPVNARYLIGHPVWLDIPASVIAAEAIHQDVPSNVVPRGDIRSFFPSNVIAQAYFRKDFPTNVVAAYQLWWEGDASVVVGTEVVQELDASTLVYMMRTGTIVHMRVMSQTTRDKLEEWGYKFGKSVEVIPGGWEWDATGIGVNEPWYDPAWAYRVKITIPTDGVAADFDDFDLLITEANLPAHFWSNVKSDGGDIVFTDDTAKLSGKLYRDLIEFDYSGQTMQVRVRCDISASTPTDIYLYYGNGSGAETNSAQVYGKLTPGDSQQRIRGFYTMEEDPGGTQPTLNERTGICYDATSYNMATGNRVDGPTPLGKAWQFNGSDERAETADNGFNIYNAYYPYTFDAWVQCDDLSAIGVVMHWMTYSYLSGTDHGIIIDASRHAGLCARDGSTFKTLYDPSVLGTGWHHIVAWFDKPNQNAAVYVDGQRVATNSTFGNFSNWVSQARVLVGCLRNHDLGLQYYFEGEIAQGRIIYHGTGIGDTDFPDDEMSTRYENESDPGNFYSVGSVETPP